MRKALPIALAAAALIAILGLAARVRIDATKSRELLPHASESPIRSRPAADPDDAPRRLADTTPIIDLAAEADATHASEPAHSTRHDDPLTIRGRVLDAQSGRPLAKAWVERSRSTNDEREVLRTDCDEAGVFELTNERELLLTLPRYEGDGAPRTLRLRAGSPGFPAREFHISAPPGTRELELTLPLPRGIPMHGLVVDLETGAPIADAAVSTSQVFASDETRSDARGAFELDVLIEAADFEPLVAAVAPGWCRVTRSVSLAHDPNAPFHTIRLPRATWIEGRVLDESGAAVAGAEVTVDARWIQASIERDWSDELRARAIDPADARGTATADSSERSVESAADGAFQSPYQVPWSRGVLVRARLLDGRAGSAVIERLGGPGEATRVSLVLGQHAGGAAVRGRMTLNGEPVPGYVSWQGATRRGYAPARDDGLYVASGVEPGSVVLTPQPSYQIVAFELDDAAVTLELSPGESREHDFALALRRGSIAGRVTRADGTPVEGVVLGARNAELGIASLQGYSDSEGRYALELPDTEAEYETLAWWANERLARTGVRSGDEGVDFVLPPAGLVRLALLDAATGHPITPAFDVDWRRASEPEYRRATPESRALDPSGRMSFVLPAGRLDLLVRAPRIGYLPQRVDGFELADSTEPRDLVLRLERAIALEVRLADGVPTPTWDPAILVLEEELASNVRRWRDESGDHWDGHPDLPGSAVCDRRLRFSTGARRTVLDGLPTGRFVLRSFPDELELEPASVELRADGPSSIELRWKRRGE